jgi:hypothetical protein
VVFLSPSANVELAPKIHVAPHASHVALPKTKFEILVKTLPSKRGKNFATLLPFQHKTQPKSQLLSSAAPSQHSTSHHLTFLTSQCYTLLTAYLPEGQAGTTWETAQQPTFFNFLFPLAPPHPHPRFSSLSSPC